MSVISDFWNEYNCYKKNNNSKALISKTSKHRNIFRFLYLKNVERKYGQKLYDILGVMNDANELETVLSLGEKKILGLLKKGEFSAYELGDAISKDGQIPIKSDEKNYTLSRIRKCIVFNKVTGLNLIEFDGIGVNPKRSYRHTTRSMIQIFEDNDISKEDLEKIYNIYGTQILEEYTEDTFLRNKSTISQRDNCIAVGGLQDHTKVYTPEELKEIIQQYFQGKEMSKENKYILVGILQKSAQLIDIYSKQHLYEHPDYIKKEVDAGIFRDISVSGKVYSNDERKEIIKLGTVWDRNSIEKKNNLGILKARVEKMLEISPCREDLRDMIEAISRIQTITVEEILGSAETIQAEINDMYLEYEIANRQQLIEKVYDPTEENKSEIVITDLAQMGEGALLHFFNPSKKPEKEDSYLKLVKQRIEQRNGKNYIGEEEELEIAKKQYEVMSNNMVTNYTVPFTGDTVGQIGTFDDRYISSVENQISALVATPEQMMRGIGIRGKLALGFSRKTLSPEMIALLAAKNVYANKGIDFIESENDFEDFSVSYSELLDGNSNEKGNEVVLFRNTDISTLKPAYVLYIATEKLDSKKEKEELDNIRSMMRNIGLDVPLCILDTYTIKEKQKQIEEQEGRL